MWNAGGVDEPKLPGKQDTGEQHDGYSHPQSEGAGHAPRLTWTATATAQHKQQGYCQAGENGEKCEAYKVGHNPDYLLNLNRKFLLISLAAVFFAGLGVYLGFWQLGRAAQKEAMQAAMTAQASRAPLDNLAVAQLSGLGADPYRRASVTGTWEVAHTVYLDNRQMDGRVGFFVLTPLRLKPDGPVVMVQRGWIGRNFESRATVPSVQTPTGWVNLEGQIAPPPSKLYEPGAPGIGLIRQNLDLAQFRQETGLALADFTLRQTGTASDGLRRDWPAVALGVEKHYGYAIQWFALAALVVGLYLWFQIFRRTSAPSKESLIHVPPTSL